MASVVLSRTDMEVLLFFEVIDIFLSGVFLVVFASRICYLKSLSTTNKYKNLFPWFRILLSVTYIAISVASMVFNIAVDFFEQWYTYILVCGGSCINSIVLVLQLLVLRLQLLKEYPYTRSHFLFFIVLSFFSTARFILMILVSSFTKNAITDFVLFGLLMADSFIQLIYWYVKRQSLPQFVRNDELNLEQLMETQNIRTEFISDKILTLSNDTTNFPFLIPFVTVCNGQIKVVLQLFSKVSKASRQTSIQKKFSSFASPNLEKSLSDGKNEDVVSMAVYSTQRLKHFYIICGRLPLKKQIDIDRLELPDLAKQFQEFLEELLLQKRWYQPQILKHLRLSNNLIEYYSDLCQQMSELKEEDEIDQKIGLHLQEDKNSIICSVHIYKTLWVSNHYEFYMKVIVGFTRAVSYPIKRYSDFQDFHHALKNIVKSADKNLWLPTLPKKHLFHWNEDLSIARRKMALQRYLRQLTNDYILMQQPQIQEKVLQFLHIEGEVRQQLVFEHDFYSQLQIVKGENEKVFLSKDYVTFYQFRLFRNGIEIKSISKRYSQFQDLHHQLERWMRNIKITFNFLEMPEKVYFGPESVRHDKLAKYLQSLVEIRGIRRLYAVNTFFNVGDNKGESMYEISSIEGNNPSKKSNNQTLINGIKQLQMNLIRSKKMSQSSRRFSKILDDLGNQNYD